MLTFLKAVLALLADATRPRRDLVLEIIALRQQLDVLMRQTRQPKLHRGDRIFWIWLRRHWSKWKSALVIVKPATILRWHREGYKRHWARKSKGRTDRPRIPRRHIEFIRRISRDHPEWGEDRIALELKLKLGVEHSTSTIRRYMIESGTPPRSTWRQFLAGHLHEMFALDFTTQFLWRYKVFYVLAIMELHTRRIVHVAVTASPTLSWVKQQIREATPWGACPRFLLHDNDGIFGQFGSGRHKGCRCALDVWLRDSLATKGIPIPYGAPNASAHIERFFGTLRRECLDHFIFLSERHLRPTATSFISYYNESRPHQGIASIPAWRAGKRTEPVATGGRLVAHPVLGGLYHDYRLAA